MADMEERKFEEGDWVKIMKSYGASHYSEGCEAVVTERYSNKYTLVLKGQGECAWFYGDQLALIEAGRMDILRKWEEESRVERMRLSDLDWIFSHGEEVLKRGHSASVEALAACFGLTNLWGSHGESFVYYANAQGTLGLAQEFLISGDKPGWLSFCDKLKSNP